MRLQRQLALAILIQGFGVIATFLISVIVSRRFGPTGQGYFSTYRSWVDLITVLGLFGFPQAFTFHINTKRITAKQASGLIVHYGVCWCLFIAFIFFISRQYIAQATLLSETDVFLMFACAMAMVFHGLFRSVTLSRSSPAMFNVITASPGLFCLAIIYWLGTGINYTILPKLIFIGFSAAGIVAAIEVGRLVGFARGKSTEKKIDFKGLLTEGTWSFIPAITTTIVPALTFWMLARNSFATTQAGYFGVSLLFLNAIVTLLNMVAPVLYNHWSKNDNNSSTQREYEKLASVCSVLGLLAFPIAWILMPKLILMIFGASFGEANAPTLVFIGACFFWLHNRILSPMLMAKGHHKIVAYGNILRSCVIIIAILVSNPLAAKSIAMCWVVGEAASFIYMEYCLKFIFECSYKKIIGFSYLLSLIKNNRKFY